MKLKLLILSILIATPLSLHAETTNSQSISVKQDGELNLLSMLVQNQDNIINIEQLGNNNTISGIHSQNFLVNGLNNHIHLYQNGSHNSIQADISANNSYLYIEQNGARNTAIITQK